jgi:uncharacterized cupin superfamily protein
MRDGMRDDAVEMRGAEQMSEEANVFAESPWPLAMEKIGIRGRPLAAAAGAREIGASVYELAPGASGFNLHAHYANEELFVVLRGRPTLRTQEGKRPLEPGDVVACPAGREGMHTIANPTGEPALVLAVSTARFPDVVLYPEIGKVGVATRHPFAPPGEDEGIVAMLDLPPEK